MYVCGTSPLKLFKISTFFIGFYFNMPFRAFFDGLISVRLVAGLYKYNCSRLMKRKFRTRSTFDIKYMQEIKFILYGNLGDFKNFNEEDKKVIKHAADQFYESEVLISGLPFYR